MPARAIDLGALGTILGTALGVVVLATFLLLRVGLPSEGATVPTSSWAWGPAGVGVVPVGPDTPFESGDEVVSIAGRPLESWAADAFAGPGDPSAIVDPLPMGIVRDGAPVAVAAPLGRFPVGEVLGGSWPLMVFVIAQVTVAGYLIVRSPTSGPARILFVGSVANLASTIPWQLGLLPSDLVRGWPVLVPFMATGPLDLVFWSSLLHLALVYPVRHRSLDRRWVAPALYVVPVAGLVVGAGMARTQHASTLGWIGSWSSVQAWMVLGPLTLGLIALVVAARRMPRTVLREVRWVMAALVVAGTAALVLVVAPLALTGTSLASRGLLALVALPVPVAIAAAIARDGLFERERLRRARERLVSAREEERRRLRRRLHDGIGPVLAGMTIELDVAAGRIATDPDAARADLGRIKGQTQAILAEIREVARELRPPALDELGLVGALRQHAEVLAAHPDHPLAVTVTVDEGLPALPAAVEVAAYRIASEAMVNAARHADAARCDVRLTVAGPLLLEVSDDGHGLVDGWRPGVGINAMRERAAELGGTLSIGPADDGGTLVLATLPWRT